MYQITLEDDLICVAVDERKYTFEYTRLGEYFPDVNEYEVEYVCADVVDKKLIIILTVASGQGGIIAVVDIDNDVIVHVQNAPFAVSATIHKDTLISLHHVMCWGVKAHFTVDTMKLGNMDMSIESQSTDIPSEIEFDFIESTVDLIVENNQLKITDKKSEYCIDISELK